ncbi:potassium channel family protein [Sphingomonas montana]|uniref:potassium channel family protein n=1 Tax=Sphingomonas montana TaxID=1843236 RepID=UPI0009F9C48E|nr:potassium channel family protein [Sphingomonas montana]
MAGRRYAKRVKGIATNAIDDVAGLLTLYIGCIFAASAVFAQVEGKPFGEALWWAFVTAMTIGYGDIYPVTVAGRIVGIALMHIVPLFIIPLITARMASRLIVDNDAFTHHEQEEIKALLRRVDAKLDEQAR